ncbi:uncharacterized protein LOC116385898 isoform X3 [Anarrhichthys ocellatus]|uniref:uncharacterized protein LOC116385898 isoform X3 n=1 Tax=Anarrhichthys ocellatus TaxID=433405 RepID=UPI0012EDF3D1|nr:carboxypeptidase O isoform X3 [Anarrhichthys ocellatus]
MAEAKVRLYLMDDFYKASYHPEVRSLKRRSLRSQRDDAELCTEPRGAAFSDGSSHSRESGARLLQISSHAGDHRLDGSGCEGPPRCRDRRGVRTDVREEDHQLAQGQPTLYFVEFRSEMLVCVAWLPDEKLYECVFQIGLNTGEEKKAIWMDCGIHAREWIAPAFCQYFVRQILQAHKTDPKMQEMLKNMDFYVTPVLNMDGYIHTWKDNTVSARVLTDSNQITFHGGVLSCASGSRASDERDMRGRRSVKETAAKLQRATIQSGNKLMSGAQHDPSRRSSHFQNKLDGKMISNSNPRQH